MRKAYKFITTLLLVIMIAVVAVLFLPRVVGLQPLAVLSGSMEPTYHVGSLIYVKDVDSSSIEVGDPVTYQISENTMVTHRVVSIDEGAQTLRTKGDANEVEDGAEVSFHNIVGKPLFTIPFLGYAAAYAATRSGIIIMITVILVIMILTFLPDIVSKEEKEDGGVIRNENNQ